MPTYVYECQKCSQVFEAEQRITEDPLTQCQFCEDGPVKRLIQPTAVMFKGSGFYVNDASSAPKSEANPDACACSDPTGPCNN